MEFFKKHGDTLVIIGVIFAHFYWIDAKFERFSERISSIEKDTNVMKAVLMMKNIMPSELCRNKDEG